mmetsp:Transcript_255/g.640  ORF Transcript_255/g.640 Transcript_255/m.640 type:complete len:345 (+) Transcript_255:326-1360(+)
MMDDRASVVCGVNHNTKFSGRDFNLPSVFGIMSCRTRHHSNWLIFELFLLIFFPNVLQQFKAPSFLFGATLHFGTYVFAFLLPFNTILQCVCQILVTGNSEYTTILQFLCQWDDVIIKKPELSFEPALCRVLLRSTSQECKVHFAKETLIPFQINVPMLHGVANVGSLDNVLDHNRSFSVNVFLLERGFHFSNFLECHIPSRVTQRFEFLIKDISCHHRVGYQVAEAFTFNAILVNASTKVLESGQKKELPSNVNRVLLRNTFVDILFREHRIFFRKTAIRDTWMTYIMDQGTEHDGEVCDGICTNPVSVVMEIFGGKCFFFRRCNVISGHHTFQEFIRRKNHV